MTLLIRSAIIIFCGALLFGAGCSSYQTEFENAKVEIAKLKASTDRLSDQVSRLQLEKKKLAGDLKELETATVKLESRALKAEKATSRLTEERDSLEKKSKELGREVAQLKKKNEELERTLKGESARTTTAPPGTMARPSLPAVSPAEKNVLSESREDLGTPREGLAEQPRTPCDAILVFMRRSEGVIRQFKGEQKANLLRKLKDEYEKQASKAPKKAWKSALEWVDEMSKAWEKTGGGDFVFTLLKKRNEVLKACNKTPEQAGF